MEPQVTYFPLIVNNIFDIGKVALIENQVILMISSNGEAYFIINLN